LHYEAVESAAHTSRRATLASLDLSMETERLELAPLLREHAKQLFPVLSEPSLYEYTQDEPPASMSALRDRFAFLESRQSPDRTQSWLNWALLERATGQAIGYVQATVTAERAEIAWVVGKDWQRRGYGGEAARALLDRLRSAGIREIRANIHPTHTASQRIAGKLGLSRTNESIAGEDVWMRRF
jgi:RimJ/RimL family protein N-acetyltransferase